MKKMVLMVISILIMLLFLIFIINYKNSNTLEKELLNLKQDFIKLNKYLNIHNYKNIGSLNVNVKYRGAHGENYPKEFVYNFEVFNNELILADEKGIARYLYDDDMLHILNNIRMVNINDFNNIGTEINGNEIMIDVDYFNQIFKTNFKTISITLNTKGLIKKVVSKVIVLDDITIEMKDNKVDISYKNNYANIIMNDDGYSLNINNKLKMNAFINDDKNSYSVIVNDFVFYIECCNNKMIIKASSEVFIYNGIEVLISFDDITIDKSKNEYLDNHIVRYLNEIDFSYWR